MKNAPEVKPSPQLFPLIIERLRMKLCGQRVEAAYFATDLKLFFKPWQARFSDLTLQHSCNKKRQLLLAFFTIK